MSIAGLECKNWIESVWKYDDDECSSSGLHEWRCTPFPQKTLKRIPSTEEAQTSGCIRKVHAGTPTAITPSLTLFSNVKNMPSVKRVNWLRAEKPEKERKLLQVTICYIRVHTVNNFSGINTPRQLLIHPCTCMLKHTHTWSSEPKTDIWFGLDHFWILGWL